MIKARNPSLLKVTYIRPDKKNERKECFQVIYLDDNGNVRYTEEPGEADIYIVKPEFRTYTYNKPQERIERMDKVRVPISKIRDQIAKESGEWGKHIQDIARERHDYKILDQLYKWPFCYACDFQPEYYYMKNWYEKYELRTPKLSKCFLDIEVDQIDYTIDLDNIDYTAVAPVNLVSVILEETKEAYTFILRPYKPPITGRTEEEYQERYQLYEQQLKAHEYLMTHRDEFYEDLHKSFDGTYGHLDYHLREYEKEIDLIADVFRLINTRKPNFCMIWNMRFDIAYLLARIKELGYDPRNIICHPDIPNPVVAFKKDNSTFQLEKQFDFFYSIHLSNEAKHTWSQ